MMDLDLILSMCNIIFLVALFYLVVSYIKKDAAKLIRALEKQERDEHPEYLSAFKKPKVRLKSTK